MDEKTLALFENKEFMDKVLRMEPEAALEEFHKNGSTITLDELKEIGAEISAAVQNKTELSEGDLESVAGGKMKDARDYAIGLAVGFCAVGVICCGW